MFFNGLPEMRVKNVVIENSTFTSVIGAVINQTSGVTMKNIKIEHKKGDILQIKNVDNGLFENITNFKGEKLPILKEGVNKDIIVK